MSNNCCIQCPYCGKDVDVIQGMEMLAGNEWTALIQGLPNSTIGILLRYLELFKPATQELRWSRRLSLTTELMPMMKAAQVKRKGITYAAPIAAWEAAMLQLVGNRPETVVLPLKGNGYLITMVAGKAEAKLAQAENQTERQRQHRAHVDNEPKAAAEVVRPPAGWKGALNRNKPTETE
ncbi:MAG: hypothetical protein WAW36_19045 [Methylovulum miyakonense]|uniref:hypothetical protein n=1 Tax=Methylovulum miyakonense TaxID=645578 RepID=UPI003BB72B1B